MPWRFKSCRASRSGLHPGAVALGDADPVTFGEPRRLREQRRLSAAAPADTAAACRGGRIGPGSVEPVAVFSCWPDGHPELCRTPGGQVKNLRARGGEKNRVLRIASLRAARPGGQSQRRGAEPGSSGAGRVWPAPWSPPGSSSAMWRYSSRASFVRCPVTVIQRPEARKTFTVSFHSAAHLVRDDVSGNDLSVSQSMHAAGERLADNIAEHEDAAGYRVGDFGIASKSEPVRLPGFPRHAPHYHSQGRHLPAALRRPRYMTLLPTRHHEWGFRVPANSRSLLITFRYEMRLIDAIR